MTVSQETSERDHIDEFQVRNPELEPVTSTILSCCEFTLEIKEPQTTSHNGVQKTGKISLGDIHEVPTVSSPSDHNSLTSEHATTDKFDGHLHRPSCLEASPTDVKLTAPPAPISAQYFTIDNFAGDVTFDQFSLASDLCEWSDLKYDVIITPQMALTTGKMSLGGIHEVQVAQLDGLLTVSSPSDQNGQTVEHAATDKLDSHPIPGPTVTVSATETSVKVTWAHQDFETTGDATSMDYLVQVVAHVVFNDGGRKEALKIFALKPQPTTDHSTQEAVTQIDAMSSARLLTVCDDASGVILVGYSGTPANHEYTIGSGEYDMTLDGWTVDICDIYDLTYEVIYEQQDDDGQWQSTLSIEASFYGNQISVYGTRSNLFGTFRITMTAWIMNQANVKYDHSVSFILTAVEITCAQVTEQVLQQKFDEKTVTQSISSLLSDGASYPASILFKSSSDDCDINTDLTLSNFTVFATDGNAFSFYSQSFVGLFTYSSHDGQLIVSQQFAQNIYAGTYLLEISGSFPNYPTLLVKPQVIYVITASCIGAVDTNVSIAIDSQSAFTYTIGDASATTSYTPIYTVTDSVDSSCTLNDLTASLIVSADSQNTNTDTTAIIVTSFTTGELDWSGVTAANTGVYEYTMILSVAVSDDVLVTQTEIVYLTIVAASCSVSQEVLVLSGGGATDQTYSVNSGSVDYQVPEFSLSSGTFPSDCASTDITYSYAVDVVDSFLTFDSATRTFTAESTDTLDAGVYNITVTGTATSSVSTVTFDESFTFTLPCTSLNLSPARVGDQNLEVGGVLSTAGFVTISDFKVTDASFYCQDAEKTYTMVVTPSNSSQSGDFITFSDTDMTVSWTNLTADNIGSYLIEITGSATLAESGITTEAIAQFYLNVKEASADTDSDEVATDFAEETTETNDAEGTTEDVDVFVPDFGEALLEPVPTIQSISSEGLIIISFNVEMVVPDDLTLFTIAHNDTGRLLKRSVEQTFRPVEVTIVPGDVDKAADDLVLLDYKVAQFSGRSLWIQLDFQKPEYVSSDLVSKDSISITFNNDDNMFVSESGLSLTSAKSEVSKVLPKQRAEGALVLQVEVEVKTATQGMVVLSALQLVLMNPALQYFVQKLLELVGPLAIVTHFVLLDLEYPVNIQEFFGLIFPMITFDVFPTDDLYQAQFQVNDMEDDALTEQFDLVGYGTMICFSNLGSLLIFMFLQPASILIFVILLLAIPRMCCLKLRIRIRKQLDAMLFNDLIAFYDSNYLVLSIIGWIGMQDLRLTTDHLMGERLGSLSSICLFTFSLAYPCLVIVTYSCKLKSVKYLHQELKKWTPEEFSQKYGSEERFRKHYEHTDIQRTAFNERYGVLLGGYNERKLGKTKLIFFIVLPLLKQLSIVVSVCVLHGYPAQSVFIFMYFTLIQMGLIIAEKPYTSRRDHWMELFNLLIMLYLTYLCLLLTHFVHRSFYVSIANLFIYATVFMVAGNFAVLVVESLWASSKHTKRWCLRKREARRLARVRLERKELLEIQRKWAFDEEEEVDDVPEVPGAKVTFFIGKESDQVARKYQAPTYGCDMYIQPKSILKRQKLEELSATKTRLLEYQSPTASKDNLIVIDLENNQPAETLRFQYLEDQPSQSRILPRETQGEILHPRVARKYNKQDMTNLQNWDRSTSAAFTPRHETVIQNFKEVCTYIDHMKTRVEVSVYDKPPVFKNPGHNKLVQNSYKDAVKRCDQQVVEPGSDLSLEIIVQRFEVQQQVKKQSQLQAAQAVINISETPFDVQLRAASEVNKTREEAFRGAINSLNTTELLGRYTDQNKQ